MLTTIADIVFLVDESGSEVTASTHEWLQSIIEPLDATLRNQNGIDVRYGLVGFGDVDDADVDRFAHSQIVDHNATPGKTLFDRLWSGNDHGDDIEAALLHLRSLGIEEDGWDAIDHAIAEYDFRPGAVPIFVLVQNQEGRIAGPGIDGINNTLTRDGVLAALKSKNVILNTLTVGSTVGNGRLFDLAPYGVSQDIRVLGVEADAADGAKDGQHDYHAFNTETDSVPSTLPTTVADALQISYNGSNTGESGMVASGKSILVGRNITGGIGPSAAGYRAKVVPFETRSMALGTAVPIGPFGSLQYSFTFNGTTFPRLWVNANGTITFADPAMPNGTTNDPPVGNNVDLSKALQASNGPARPTIAALWDEFSRAPYFRHGCRMWTTSRDLPTTI